MHCTSNLALPVVTQLVLSYFTANMCISSHGELSANWWRLWPPRVNLRPTFLSLDPSPSWVWCYHWNQGSKPLPRFDFICVHYQGIWEPSGPFLNFQGESCRQIKWLVGLFWMHVCGTNIFVLFKLLCRQLWRRWGIFGCQSSLDRTFAQSLHGMTMQCHHWREAS